MSLKTEGRILRSLSGFYDVQTVEGLITCRASRGISESFRALTEIIYG